MWPPISDNLQESARDPKPQSYVFGRSAFNKKQSRATVSRSQSVCGTSITYLRKKQCAADTTQQDEIRVPAQKSDWSM